MGSDISAGSRSKTGFLFFISGQFYENPKRREFKSSLIADGKFAFSWRAISNATYRAQWKGQLG